MIDLIKYLEEQLREDVTPELREHLESKIGKLYIKNIQNFGKTIAVELNEYPTSLNITRLARDFSPFRVDFNRKTSELLITHPSIAE